MDKRIEELLAQAKIEKRKTTAPAIEVLEHLYQAILAVPEFTLKDGKKARLDPYIKPEIDEDGNAQCGFDILLDDGSHLEFMVSNTGWGRALSETMAKFPRQSGRSR